MPTPSTSGLRTWIEIDTKALKHNYATFRSLFPKSTKLMSVVKSNAYGHGLVRFSKEIEKLGADWLGVDSIVEALRLREEGIKIPILVLGYTLPEMVEKAIDNDISLTVSSFDFLRYLPGRQAGIVRNKYSKKLKIHIKVDSGMHRQGFLLKDLPLVLKLIHAPGFMSHVSIEGLYTHFAAAKNPAFPKDTLGQIEVFDKWVKAFRDAGLRPIVHATATSGTIIFPKSHFNMVRIGIGMYGLWPSKEVKAFAARKITLKPILAWKTIISEIKSLPKGEKIGYDFTEELQRNSRIAMCPIGYWHGYPRSLSSIGEVLVRGERARILGRVSMDMIIVDVTDIRQAKVLDEVVIIGKDGKESISAEDIAYLTDSSWYEIVTRINPLIQKIYK